MTSVGVPYLIPMFTAMASDSVDKEVPNRAQTPFD